MVLTLGIYELKEEEEEKDFVSVFSVYIYRQLSCSERTGCVLFIYVPFNALPPPHGVYSSGFSHVEVH